MLSPFDRDLVRRDPALPGLATLLDPEALAAVLGKTLGPLDAAELRVPYLRYKPGTNGLVTIHLPRQSDFPLGYAKAHPPGRADKLAKAHQRIVRSAAVLPLVPALADPAKASPFAPSRWVVEALGLEVNLFPNDNKLFGLERVTSVAWATELVRRALADDQLEVTQIHPLAYKPERRWVARWDLSDHRHLVAKTCTPNDYPATKSRAQLTGRDAAAVGPKLVGHRDRYHTLLLEWTDGTPLPEAWRRPDFSPHRLREVGTTLAAFHRRPCPSHSASAAPSSRTDEVLDLEQTLVLYLPHLGPELDRVLRQGLLPRWRSHASASILHGWCHGDFHSRQVLLDEDRVALLDFDEARLDDPAADLGDFLASLEVATLREFLSVAQREAFAAEFLAGYAAGALDGSWRERLPLHIATDLLALTPHFFRTRDPRWVERTTASLARIAEILELDPPKRRSGPTAAREDAEGSEGFRPPPRNQAGPGQPPSPSRARAAGAGPKSALQPPPGDLHDPALPMLAPALDRTVAQAAMLPELARALGQRDLCLHTIELQRHKPGRRGLIRYEFRDPEGRTIQLAGKLRRRGVDSRNFAQLRALARDSFTPGAADGISIPEPLAAIPGLGLVLQRWMPGGLLTERLFAPDALAAAARAAEALHKLHRSRPLPSPRPHSIVDELGILRERLTETMTARSTEAGEIRHILDRCEAVAKTLPVRTDAPIHRDFYPDQLLLDGPRTYLLDLDLLALGDPALDAGNFLAHVIEQSLRETGDPTRLRAVETAFRDRFLALDAEVTAERVHAYTLLSLARHIHISTRIPERRGLTRSLIELCAARLAEPAAPRPTLVSFAPVTATSTPCTPLHL